MGLGVVTSPYSLTGPDVFAIVNVIGLHAWQLVIAKNVWHPVKSRLIYRDRPEPTLPPAEDAGSARSGSMFASRKAQNQTLKLALWQAPPTAYSEQFASWE